MGESLRATCPEACFVLVTLCGLTASQLAASFLTRSSWQAHWRHGSRQRLGVHLMYDRRARAYRAMAAAAFSARRRTGGAGESE